MKGKKILSLILSAAMVLGLFAGNPVSAKAAEVNLAKGKTATASSYESGTSFTADKVVDGNTSTRWGTGQNAAVNEWIEVDLGAEMEITKIKIHFERSNDEQNILSYKVETCGANGEYTKVYQKDEKAAQIEEITFETAKTIQKVKLTVLNADGGTMNYVNVGVGEIEVYGEAGQGGTGETEPPVTEDEAVNLAQGKTATADSSETSSFGASKAVDGDTESTSSRWASAVDNAGGAHWIAVDLGETKSIKTVRIFWELRKATAYKIQVSNDGSSWSDVKVIGNRPAALKDTIVLEKAVEARHVRLYIDSFTSADPDGGMTWATVSIFELEVYSGNAPADPVKPIDTIEVKAPALGDTKLDVTIPEETDTYRIEYNGTDYEQVIGDDLTIYTPLVDKTVKVSFKATNKNNENYEFKEFEVVVPGLYSTEAGDNEAPKVIPELAEWKGSTGVFEAVDSAKIVYADDELKAMAEAFAEDYKDVTGKEITIVKGTEAAAAAGDYYFALTTDTSLGLQEEGYLMEIDDIIHVQAETETGAYWATRTILQSYTASSNTINKGIARDYPLYEVRGFILDVGRKTYTIDYLNNVAEMMSWYKMNDFHVHLSDNLIFLEDYTAVGKDPLEAYSGFRLESDIKAGGNNGLNKADLTSTDVFYTKDEFRSFIQDSRVRGVNIVPEIDVPGHALPLTKVRPDLRHGTTCRQADQLNLLNQYEECLKFVKSIFDEYITGENPVFDEETVIHIGTDEYEGGSAPFRKFTNDMFDYLEELGRSVRVWGSLSALSSGEEVRGDGAENGERVQMNLWSNYYAEFGAMYKAGFDLINCNETPYYIVPNAGYYNDYLNANTVYNQAINTIGGVTIPAGDEQMLGGAFALWNDMVDIYDNGITEYDSYMRIKDSVPLMGAKLWGKQDKTLAEAQSLAAELGDGPGVDFTYQTEADKYGVIGEFADEEITLTGGSDYVETGLTTVGLDNILRVKVKRASESTEEQILFESSYGSIKAVQKETGKVGFTRENHDYSFNYELPVGEWVELEFRNKYEVISLYVNGELTDTIGDDETVVTLKANDRSNPTGTTEHVRSLKATMMFPVEKIGSATNAFIGSVKDVVIETQEAQAHIDSSLLSASASSYQDAGSAPEMAIDGDASTIWHSNWDIATMPHWFQLTFNGEPKEIDGITYITRQSGTNGNVTKYEILGSNDGESWTEITSGTLGSASGTKEIKFAPVTYQHIRINYVEAVHNNGSAAEFMLHEVVVPDKGTLEEGIKNQGTLVSTDYTAASWEAYQVLLAQAQEVLSNPDASAREVSRMIAKLKDAKAALVPISAEHTHAYGNWTTKTEATVFAKKVEVRKCSCGVEETREVGEALKPSMSTNALKNKITLSKNQNAAGFKITDLEKGDSIVSITTSNKKVVNITKVKKAKGTCTLKAGKQTGKKGKATITITLASGLKKTIKVTVQNAKVKTTKISGLKKTMTLNKGEKQTLKPVLVPFTSQDKVKFTTSNKKLVTVTNKGKITAKKKGKAAITVKAGKKSFKIKVTVK